MTLRERVFAILDGTTPDKVPWFGDLDCWVTAMISRGKKTGDFKESDDYIRSHRDLGVGFCLQGYLPFTKIIDGCDVKTWKEDNDRFREIVTPRGTMRECRRWLETSFSESPAGAC